MRPNVSAYVVRYTRYISVMYCTLHSTINDSQSLNILCGSVYNKISADCICRGQEPLESPQE